MCAAPLQDVDVSDDHTAENESLDHANNTSAQEHVITVNSITWKNESHSLFDNKADEEKLVKKTF